MNDLPPRTGDDADDALLLERARAGDSDAFGELYKREIDPATRLARILVGDNGADELVAESFAKVLAQLQAGRGPTDDFRAYLQVTIRNGFRDGLRGTKESPSSDQPWLLDDVLPPVEELVEDLDRDVAVTALATLPKSWQQVLWHLEVEGRKPAEVAGLLDMDAGAVSSLAYRAREGLKRAYLDQHFQPAAGGQCGWTQTRMSQYVRGDLSPRAQQKVADHLDDCSACGAAFVAVDRVNQKLAAWLFPVVLWGIAGAHKGGLLWFAGAAGAGGAGTTPGGSPGGSGHNPLVVGAVATAVACGLAGGVAFAVVAAKDEPRDNTTAESPVADDAHQDPPPADQPPANEPPANEPPANEPPAATSTDEPDAVEPPAAAPTSTTPTSEPTQPSSEPAEPTEPTEPTEPAEPTEPTEPPDPVEVVPEAPVEVDISACGTDGSLDLPETEGVSYDRTVGSGTEGPWEVEASADEGYVIADGATTHFAGDLGAYYPCVTLTDVDEQRNGPPLITPWEFRVTVDVQGTRPATVDVVFDFTQPVFLFGQSQTGWACDGALNPLVLLGGPVTCTFDYTGVQPPAVEVDARALVPSPNDHPPGTVTVRSNGQVVDQGAF